MREPRTAALVRSLVITMLFASRTLAQVTPGPLSESHAHLEGLRNCMDCHGGRKGTLDERCLDCHREIRQLQEERRGLHAHSGAEACARCHPEHGGREMAIVRWPDGGGRPEEFAHGRSGWDLTGRHADVACRDCHRPENQASGLMEMRPGDDAERSWLGMGTACASCHRDPHEGRLGSACADCHTTASFREIRRDTFDHDLTAYPLRGAHARAACDACHDHAGGGWNRPSFRTCGSCHDDPHAGSATVGGRAADCAECHRVEGFAPSTFTVEEHRSTSYPLLGKHRNVACRSCHTEGPAKARREAAGAAFRFHPNRGSCRECHGDAHGAQLDRRADGGACETCHGVEGFSPSSFGKAEHDAVFPLLGGHAEAACRACHGPRRTGLPAVPRSDSVGPAGVLLRFATVECEDCHRDPHRGRFDPDGERPQDGCLSCHGYDSFLGSDVGVEMHARFRFPLEGAHATVPCIECHRELDRTPAASTLLLAAPARDLTFEADHRECRSCHRDPHGGQFDSDASRGDCATCHGLDSFVPAVGFDHDRDARFPLEAGHAGVVCGRCHASGLRADGSTGVVYRPIAHRCRDCHTAPSPERGTTK